jgi:hypothetical protein
LPFANMFCRAPAPAGGFRAAVSSVKSLKSFVYKKSCIEPNTVSYHYISPSASSSSIFLLLSPVEALVAEDRRSTISFSTRLLTCALIPRAAFGSERRYINRHWHYSHDCAHAYMISFHNNVHIITPLSLSPPDLWTLF